MRHNLVMGLGKPFEASMSIRWNQKVTRYIKNDDDDVGSQKSSLMIHRIHVTK